MGEAQCETIERLARRGEAIISDESVNPLDTTGDGNPMGERLTRVRCIGLKMPALAHLGEATSCAGNRTRLGSSSCSSYSAGCLRPTMLPKSVRWPERAEGARQAERAFVRAFADLSLKSLQPFLIFTHIGAHDDTFSCVFQARTSIVWIAVPSFRAVLGYPPLQRGGEFRKRLTIFPLA